jgi:hypothetical protein
MYDPLAPATFGITRIGDAGSITGETVPQIRHETWNCITTVSAPATPVAAAHRRVMAWPGVPGTGVSTFVTAPRSR